MARPTTPRQKLIEAMQLLLEAGKQLGARRLENDSGVVSTVFFTTAGELLWVHGHGVKKHGHMERIPG